MKHRTKLQLRAALPGIDKDLLASHLRHRLRQEALSQRSAAAQMGCSPATLSRLLSGSASGHGADTATLAIAALWLNRSLADFDVARRPVTSSLADIKMHLLALPQFTAADVHVVMAVVEALQEIKRKNRSKKRV